MKKFYSTLDLAAICGVDPVTVARWCDQGGIVCHRTPGGHRRIRKEDLIAFLRKHGMGVPEELGTGNLRVLAVIGDPKLLDIVKRRYRNHGGRIEMITATNGIEGLLKIGTHKPEVVLFDMQIPGVDGVEACRQIRGLSWSHRMKIVALSGGDRSTNCRKALKAGAAVCLPKPPDLEDLDTHILPSSETA